MGQSYDIYLHDVTGKQSKPTQPKENGGTNTTPKQTEEADGAEGLYQAASKGGKAGKVALAFAILGKVASETVSFIAPLVARETGDYRFTTWAHNFKQTIKNGLPSNFVNYTMSRINYYQENMLINNRQEQQRLLVGDSYLNDVSRKV